MYLPHSIAGLGDRILAPVLKQLHKLGITPNHVTLASFLLSVVAAVFLYLREWLLGFILLALSLFADGLDGALARRYKLASERGELMDTLSDRASEFLLFLALALNGSVEWVLMLLAYYAILLCTLLRKKAKLDLGFKRIGLFFGYVLGFSLIFSLIFIVNLLCFILQLLILDYKEDNK